MLVMCGNSPAANPPGKPVEEFFAEDMAVRMIKTFTQTTVGQKVLMAVTGLILFLFILGHLSGNLLIFAGREHMNEYAHFLHEHPKFLWPARIVLLFCFFVHIVAAARLWLKNRSAREEGYTIYLPIETTIAARTMIYGGAAIFFFLLWHLLHLTFGVVGPRFDPNDVYGNVVRGFQNPAIAGIYLVGVACLCAHLYHGAWSLLHTLGLSAPEIDCAKKKAARILAVLIGLGYASIPLAVLTGVVR